jgi:hypothetical protein
MSTATGMTPGHVGTGASIKDEIKNLARIGTHSSDHAAKANMIDPNKDNKVCAD